MHPDPESRLRHIAAALSARAPRLAGGCPERGRVPDRSLARRCASVALVVRPGGSELDLLLIKRATLSGDPWSGHMALPGGRRAPDDPGGFHTAVRETAEEVGLDLTAARFLGRLDDVEPRTGAPEVVVSPYAFAVAADADLRLNHEVALALWVPFGDLADPASETEHLHALAGGTSLSFPAIVYREHVIWGITHRIIAQFIDIAREGPEQGRKP